jgi:cytochrome c
MLLVAMLAALYGCQPETPAQSSAEPAMEPPVEAMPAAPMAMTPAEPAMAEMPAAAMEQAPAPMKKEPEPMMKDSGAMMEKPAEMKPATMTEKAAPAAAMANPAPAAEAKPEAKAMLSEADVLALAKKNGCMVCHAIDKKVVGPAWKDVAAKYRGDAGAEAKLMDKIAKGGSGVWGSIAMPPNPKLNEADRRALAAFVLSLK